VIHDGARTARTDRGDAPVTSNDTDDRRGAAARLATRLIQRANREFSRIRALPYERLPPREAVRVAYNVLLRRDPDPAAWDHYTGAVRSGVWTRADIADRIRGSSEYRTQVPFGPSSFFTSLHASRCEFVLGLPPARRIVDMGGGHTTDGRGALVVLGYPYPFDDLVIVDLPQERRHDLYRSEAYGDQHTSMGTVRYEYRSMSDLSFAGDASVDLVYSGQSIEHVSEDEGDVALAEAFRVLEPGGHLALDTPNAAVCRLEQDAFIDPDHKVEYTLDVLTDKVKAAGFEMIMARGLNWGGTAIRHGVFDLSEVAAHNGIFYDAASCYLLALLCRKPLTDAS
jgi:SAM-dependent methyltransferase